MGDAPVISQNAGHKFVGHGVLRILPAGCGAMAGSEHERVMVEQIGARGVVFAQGVEESAEERVEHGFDIAALCARAVPVCVPVEAGKKDHEQAWQAAAVLDIMHGAAHDAAIEDAEIQAGFEAHGVLSGFEAAGTQPVASAAADGVEHDARAHLAQVQFLVESAGAAAEVGVGQGRACARGQVRAGRAEQLDAHEVQRGSGLRVVAVFGLFAEAVEPEVAEDAVFAGVAACGQGGLAGQGGRREHAGAAVHARAAPEHRPEIGQVSAVEQLVEHGSVQCGHIDPHHPRPVVRGSRHESAPARAAHNIFHIIAAIRAAGRRGFSTAPRACFILSGIGFRVFFKEFFNLFLERWKMFADYIPHDFVVNEVISMDKHIAESDDTRIVADSLRDIRIKFRNPSDGFSGNFKTALNGIPQLKIRLIIIECFV